MEKIHEPWNRKWISEKVTPKQTLDKYKERVSNYKPIISVNEGVLRPSHLQNLIGVDDETFKELEDAMDIENLTTEGEPVPMQVVNPNWSGGVYGIGVPKFAETPISENARLSLRTLYVQDHLKRKIRKDKSVQAHRRRELLEMNDNTFLSQPPTMKYKTDFSDRKHLYTIKVYRPFVHPNIAITDYMHKDLTVAQEIWLLGENYLTELRDKITCAIDNNFVGEQQVDTIEKLAPRAGDVYKSGFFFIGECFYVDTRHEENIDYSQVIIDWARKSNREMGPFTKGIMEDTKMDDLSEFRVGYPYLFTHQGNHEHIIVITDVRLVGPEDPQSIARYPLVRSVGLQQSRMCMVCQVKIATWVTINNSRVAENPFFFCTLCYKSFNLKKDGNKEGRFEEYRYHDVNSV